MSLDKIKLKDLIRTGQTELSVQESYDYEDLPLKAPVAVQAHLNLSSTGVVVLGKLKAIIEEPCDRCSEPFEREINESFQERFVYNSLIESFGHGAEIQLQSEDFYDTLGPESILDLKDLVHQFVVLGMSINRVCEGQNCYIRA